MCPFLSFHYIFNNPIFPELSTYSPITFLSSINNQQKYPSFVSFQYSFFNHINPLLNPPYTLLSNPPQCTNDELRGVSEGGGRQLCQFLRVVGEP